MIKADKGECKRSEPVRGCVPAISSPDIAFRVGIQGMLSVTKLNKRHGNTLAALNRRNVTPDIYIIRRNLYFYTATLDSIIAAVEFHNAVTNLYEIRSR